MTIEGLKFVNSCLDDLKIPFEFMEWTASKIPDPYWVTEYTEVESMDEDGMEETAFILTGTTKKKYFELEKVKELLKDTFWNGLTAVLDNGQGIAINYGEAYPIPSIDEGVHRIQITLKIKEWKGR